MNRICERKIVAGAHPLRRVIRYNSLAAREGRGEMGLTTPRLDR
jgi:hypothetical protein